MNEALKTIFLFLIGIPVVMGFMTRKKTYGSTEYWKIFVVTIIAFAAVGIGYSFLYYSNPPSNILSKKGILGVLLFLCWILYDYYENRSLEYDGIWLMYLIGSLFAGVLFSEILISNGYNGVVSSVIICSIFIIAGGVFAISGPILSGFNVSALIYAIIFGGGVENIFLWKDFFELFDISNYALKAIIFLGSTFSGAVQFVEYFHNVFEDS